MFKILILQTLYTLSDDATEFQSGTGSRSCGSSALASRLPCPTPRRCGYSGNT